MGSCCGMCEHSSARKAFQKQAAGYFSQTLVQRTVNSWLISYWCECECLWLANMHLGTTKVCSWKEAGIAMAPPLAAVHGNPLRGAGNCTAQDLSRVCRSHRSIACHLTNSHVVTGTGTAAALLCRGNQLPVFCELTAKVPVGDGLSISPGALLTFRGGKGTLGYLMQSCWRF